MTEWDKLRMTKKQQAQDDRKNVTLSPFSFAFFPSLDLNIGL
jgi:hypothetical protein